ncbi:hypothetical protein OF83DRAFT_1061446 [Amylostereum chailletii]|nr:hypothetical protein OF83DRAFT_1061446 [Amylostereum chailletii]
MKFFAVVAALVAAVAAQNIEIGYPAAGASVKAGDPMFVQVNRPNSLTGSTEVTVVVSMASCSNGCIDPSEYLGSTLYHGAFDPEYPTNRTPQDVPQQKFTVTVPDTFPAGQAVLSVVHLSLVGAGPFPLYEIKNVTVNVE